MSYAEASEQLEQPTLLRIASAALLAALALFTQPNSAEAKAIFSSTHFGPGDGGCSVAFLKGATNSSRSLLSSQRLSADFRELAAQARSWINNRRYHNTTELISTLESELSEAERAALWNGQSAETHINALGILERYKLRKAAKRLMRAEIKTPEQLEHLSFKISSLLFGRSNTADWQLRSQILRFLTYGSDPTGLGERSHHLSAIELKFKHDLFQKGLSRALDSSKIGPTEKKRLAQISQAFNRAIKTIGKVTLLPQLNAWISRRVGFPNIEYRLPEHLLASLVRDGFDANQAALLETLWFVPSVDRYRVARRIATVSFWGSLAVGAIYIGYDQAEERRAEQEFQEQRATEIAIHQIDATTALIQNMTEQARARALRTEIDETELSFRVNEALEHALEIWKQKHPEQELSNAQIEELRRLIEADYRARAGSPPQRP